MTTAVVVPCYDEADRLRPGGFVELAAGVDRLLFVDDGSTDGTAELLRHLAADLTGDLGGEHGGEHGVAVDVVELPENLGKAEAVRTGMVRAIELGADLVGYLDADLATPADEMLRLVRLAADQPDRVAVIGSRVALLGHTVRRRPVRHYLGRLYATAASLALDVAVYDTQCGAKVFRVGPPLRAALARPFHDRWSFDVELLGRLLAHPDVPADPVLEVPLRAWSDVGDSRITPVDAARAALALAGLRRRIRAHVAASA